MTPAQARWTGVGRAVLVLAALLLLALGGIGCGTIEVARVGTDAAGAHRLSLPFTSWLLIWLWVTSDRRRS